MNKALRHESLKSLLPQIILTALLTIGFLAVSCQGLLMLLSGPRPLAEQDLEQLKGNYVSFDASEVIVAFASLSQSNDSGSETLRTYYLLPAGDGTYLTVMDTKEKNSGILEKAMEQSHEYYLGDLETLTPLGRIQGTAAQMESGMTDYMVDCIENYELPGYQEGGDTSALIRPVQINLNKVGFLPGTAAVVLGAIGLVFLLLTLALLVPALAGFYQKKAGEIVLRDHTPQEAESLFQQAEQIERVWAGTYIWYQKGAATKVLKTADLIWGYPMPEPLVVSKYRWPVALYDLDQNMTQVCFMEKKSCERFLSAIAAQGHPFVSGYTTAYAQQFQTDFEGFVAQAKQAAEQ